MISARYWLRRLGTMVPTLIGITFLTFALMNLAPGDLVEQKLQMLTMAQANGSGSVTNSGRLSTGGVSPEIVSAIRHQYGLDQPLLVRYRLWLTNLAHLRLGDSYEYNRPVLDLICERFPVSLQFGILSFVLTYFFAVGAGILMATHSKKWLDSLLSAVFLAASATPAFVLAVLLLLLFAGGSFVSWFPVGFLQSENFASFSVLHQITDRVWHFALPLFAYTVGGLASLAFITRNSVLDEIKKDYVRTARAFGASESQIYRRNAFRNAMIPIVTGIGGFVGVFLSGSLLIENIFQLNGIGRLSYEAILSRDYNLIMGLTVLQAGALLVGNLFGDFVYVLVDPRISYET